MAAIKTYCEKNIVYSPPFIRARFFVGALALLRTAAGLPDGLFSNQKSKFG
jgi:hypothetical protein